MRTCIPFAFVTILWAASSLPATAQIRLDMNQVTCNDYLGYSPESRDFIRFWMSGYYSAAANNSVLNYDRLQSNSTKVMNYCRAHKSDTLPTAIQKVTN